MGYDNIIKIHPQIYFNSKDNEVRTKDNFEKLLKLFENEQFKDIHNNIREDMESLK
jgi:ABC-type enterochelin transport system substrate-binding protein